MDKDKDKDKDDKRVLQGSTTPGSPSVSQSSELRVRLPEFSITVGPSSRTLSNYQARRVRDVAETEVENYIRTVYELSAETVYDYASLLGVGSVEWSNTDQTTTIHLLGALVVFQAGSTVVPSIAEAEALVQEALTPTNGGLNDGLLGALRSIALFTSYTEADVSYPNRPSSSPSAIPSSSPSSVPSWLPSMNPTVVPTVTKDDDEEDDSLSATGIGSGAIGGDTVGNSDNNGVETIIISGGAVIAVGAVLALAFLALKRRREPTEPVNKVLQDIGVSGDGSPTQPGMNNINGDDEELKRTGLQYRDSLDRQNASDSDTGSSLLGRVLSSAASIVPTSTVLQWTAGNQSPANTPACDSDESLEGSGRDIDMDDVGSLNLVAVMDFPPRNRSEDASTILSVTQRSTDRGGGAGEEDVESFILHNHGSIHKDMLTSNHANARAAGDPPSSFSSPPAPSVSSSPSRKRKHVLKMVNVSNPNPWQSGAIPPSPQGSASSYRFGSSTDQGEDEDDDEQGFAPDASWDFHDNSKDESDDEPQSKDQFYTTKAQGGQSLLDRFFTRSSADGGNGR